MSTIVEAPLFSKLWPDELIVLVIYAKSARESIPAHVLKQIAEERSDAPP